MTEQVPYAVGTEQVPYAVGTRIRTASALRSGPGRGRGLARLPGDVIPIICACLGWQNLVWPIRSVCKDWQTVFDPRKPNLTYWRLCAQLGKFVTEEKKQGREWDANFFHANSFSFVNVTYNQQMQQMAAAELAAYLEPVFAQLFAQFFTKRTAWVIGTQQHKNRHQNALVRVSAPVRDEHWPVLHDWIRRLDHFMAARNPYTCRLFRCIGNRECALNEPLTSGILDYLDKPESNVRVI